MRRLAIALLAALAVSAILSPSRAWADSSLRQTFRRESTSVEIDSGRLRAVVQVDPWHLVVKERSTDRRLVEEYPVERSGRYGRNVGALGFLVSGGSGRSFAQWYRVSAVLGVTREPDAIQFLAATDDPSGRRLEIRLWFPSPTTLALRVTPRPTEGVLEVAEGLWSMAGEHYLGLGARFGPTDARGMEIRTRVEGHLDTISAGGNHVSVPFFVSSRAYGVAVHGTQESVFQLNTVRPDAAIFKVIGSTLHFTLLTERTPLDVVAHHATMVGPPARPPLWAFGVWKTVLGGDERLLAEAERLRRHGLPVNVLWSYDMVDEGRHLGWKHWVYRPIMPGTYRDLASLTSRLRAMGYHTLGYVSPEFRTDSPLFRVGSAHGYFIRDQRGRAYVMPGMQGHPVALLDFTNPEAVHWWQSLTRSILTELGFDGWMQDGGDRAPEDGVYFSGVTGAEARNTYPIAYACATHEAAIRARPEYVSFMRAGFAGSQRHTPLTWQCDNVFSWSPSDGMPAALRAALSGSVSGFPFWAPDIGGYSGCGAGWEADEELWVRWVQLGALHPVMRDHLGHKCRWALDLWTTPATIAAFRQYAELHQRLVPYLYGLAVDASTRGFPLMRLVALISPHDPRAYEDEFTYLLGGDLLVAAVMEPGARQRRLFVPEGEWIDWWDGERYRGPAFVTVAAPLDRIPLFVRAGAILPLAPPAGSLTRVNQPEDSDVPLILRVYSASDAVAERRLTLFDGVEVTVRRTATGRSVIDLTGAPRRRTLLLVLVGEPAPPLSVRAYRGPPIAPESGGQCGGDVFGGWWHDPQTSETTITVPGTVDGLEVYAPNAANTPCAGTKQ